MNDNPRRKNEADNLTEAQSPESSWNLHERLITLVLDRQEKEFLDWAMDENQRNERKWIE